ncbi:MAG TPA: oligopeptide/dipeptide ABC transporter ATP-binding protein [Stellaceae bacterium]|jgi:peptide/nickel transport system ATP-binding protein/oligopeptide transport system ATP-binding protein|nr:oligopeptide/dipeptide ABC transporter ATP-binding protein [Stellaceae bacterium]
MTEALLAARGVVKHFPVRDWLGRKRAAVRAVDGVSLRLDRGETLGLVGESGCGKSTLGRVLLRLIEADRGDIEFAGRDVRALNGGELRALRAEAQMVFQDPYASLNPRMTIGDALAEPLALHDTVPSEKRAARVAELLTLVGLRPGQGRRYPHEFSGGQRQRIGIARALAANPKLLVCDEPVSALDVSIQAQIINLLQALKARFGLSLLFIAHDLAVVRHVADRVAVMYLGRIVETAPGASLFSAPRHPYTRALLAAVPVPDPALRRERTLLAGEIPSPLAPPSGCRFHTRCPFARERCSVDDPALTDDGDGHETACHFWRELPPPAALSDRGAADARLVRLQQFFDRPEAAEMNGRPT